MTWAVVVGLLAGACGSGETTSRRESATTAPTPQPTVAPTATDVAATVVEPTVELPQEWVAVFRVADVDALHKETQELLRLVPRNIAVAPIGCWVGLMEELGNPVGESVYVSAVVADTRRELERVVDKVGRQPILVGEFPAMCVD
jgi:hypothetical protein